MIRPLRRRHSWMLPALFILLVIVVSLALTHPAPSARTESLPPALAGDARGVRLQPDAGARTR
jgi:hypothetical protein